MDHRVGLTPKRNGTFRIHFCLFGPQSGQTPVSYLAGYCDILSVPSSFPRRRVTTLLRI